MKKNKNLFKKPAWLNKRIDFKKCDKLNKLLKDLKLNTICQEALCPNISECFSKGVATFLIMGNVCTRGCNFCAVQKGSPQKLDPDEPKRVAEAIKRLGLKHVVITSVTRDDLADGGARAFIDNIEAIRELDGKVRIEVLVPDFKGRFESIREVIEAEPDIFAHNLETVPRFYKEARKGASYQRSLSILEIAKELNANMHTKSGLMLGLGEREEEILEVFSDLRKAKCDFLSLGQYLAPSHSHLKVKEYINLKKFDFYKEKALKLGFRYVASGPYVRSSYLACDYLG